ncbi:MAG: hypothetical protein JKX83_00430, partial [Pseudomonadales bacterium]|nr:hypothetical protein [Pseudomonadales bacterium]
MTTFSNTVLWAWIKQEIESALELAVECLRQLSEDTANATVLEKSIEPLATVSGVLNFTGLKIAAQQVRETAHLFQIVNNSNGDIPASLLAPVLEATLRLQLFIEDYKPESASQELKLLPCLHDILALSQQSPITEYGFHLPSKLTHSSGAKMFAAEHQPATESFDQIKKLRDVYRFNLLVLIRNRSIETNTSEKTFAALRAIRKVFIHLSKMLPGSPHSELYDISNGLIEAIERQQVPLRPGIFSLLKIIDSYISQLFSPKGSEFSTHDYALLKNQILFYLVPCTKASPFTKKIRDQNSLDELLSSSIYLVDIIEPNFHASANTLQAAAQNFSSEITEARVLLSNIQPSSEKSDAIDFDILSSRFRHFEKLSGFLNYDGWTNRFSELSKDFLLDINTENSNSHIETANKLLTQFEQFLREQHHSNIDVQSQRAATKELLGNLNHIFIFVEQFFSDSDNKSSIEQAYSTLNLFLDNLEASRSQILRKPIQQYQSVLNNWAGADIPVTEEFERCLIDFLVLIQFHLESNLYDQHSTFENSAEGGFLAVAISCLSVLEKPQPEPTSSEPAQQAVVADGFDMPDGDLIDDEILEIFSEEAEEVLEVLQ